MLKIKKFDLLVSIYIFCICASEMMGAKTFPLLSSPIKLNASVAIFVIPLLFTINDMIVEVFGVERARSVVRSGLIVIFLIFFFSILAVALPPSTRFIDSNSAYKEIFSKSIRISGASLTAFAIAEFLDVAVFARLRKRFGKTRLWLRNNLSNFVSEFFDTFIFMTLAFYSFSHSIGNNASFLWSLILPYWLLKCTMSILETPLVYLGVKWLRTEKTT